MSSVQMESGTFDNWKALINSILLDSGRFEKSSTGIKEQTDIEVFRLKDDKSEYITNIEAGYLDDRLFYLNINNPQIPGYIKFQEGEYFHQYDFIKSESKGMPGLEFNEVNAQAILNEFKKGLQGRELQYLRGGKVVKVNLYPFPEKPGVSYTYDFEKLGLIERFKNILNKSENKLEMREINLNDIFSGI
jgi:hypothetical protein